MLHDLKTLFEKDGNGERPITGVILLGAAFFGAPWLLFLLAQWSFS